MDIIEDLSQRIHLNPLGKSTGFLEPFFGELNKINIPKFIAHNFRSFSNVYTFELMLELKNILEELDLQDYSKIVEHLKEDFIPLMYFISFIYKYIGVNLLESSDIEKKEKLKEYLSDRPGYLQNSANEMRLLKWHELDSSSFSVLKIKLINQGAEASNPIFVELKPLNSDDWHFDSETGNYKFL